MKRLILTFALLFVSTCFSQTLEFVSNENLVEQNVAGIVLENLYSKINQKINITPLPALRANSMNLSEKVSGEIARIATYGLKNPQLVKVDPAYYYLTTSVYCLSEKSLAIKQVSDLEKFKVATIRGVAHSDKLLVGHKNILTVSDAEQMFDLVSAGRVDFAIDTGINGSKFLKKSKYQKISNCGDIAKHELHVYLNKSHENQKDILSKLIKESISKKELPKLWKAAEEKVLKMDL